MALITSAASGNFSAGATWTGGVVPGVGDEARASNGHTVTIDVDTTCDEVSNAGTGIFTLNDGVTLTANVTNKSTTVNRAVVQFTAASPAVGTIVGNCTGGTVGGAIAVNNTSTGTISIAGNVTGGSAAANFAQGAVNSSTGAITITGNVSGGSGASAYGVQNVSTGTMTITGNVTGGSGSGAYGCNNTSTGTITITGNATGGSGSGAFGCNNASSGTLTITGNATGGSGGFAYGCNNASSGTLTITGNATGGSATSAYGCNNTSTGTITITGNATGGSGSGAFGCNNASTGTLTLSGIATGGTTNGAAGANNASSGTLNVGRAKGNDFGIGSTGIAAGFGVASLQASITKIKELEYGARGMSPTSGPVYLEPVLGNIAILVEYPSGSGSKTLSDPNNTAGLSPAITDVRTGVVYNNGNDTGTCAVPAAASVGFGVPVDATTGTAALTPASVWDHLLSAITTSSTIGKLLKDNVDATISSRSTATTAGIADAVWDEVLTGATHNIATSAGKRLRQIANERIIAEGQTVSATTNTITLEPIGTLCVGQTIVVTDQITDDKQTRFILAFDTGTDTATVDSNWCVVPTAGDEYLLTTVRDPLITRGDHPTGTVGAEIDEMYLLQGLSTGDTLTVTPTSRTAGAISQTIGGDGTTTTTVSRD